MLTVWYLVFGIFARPKLAVFDIKSSPVIHKQTCYANVNVTKTLKI